MSFLSNRTRPSFINKTKDSDTGKKSSALFLFELQLLVIVFPTRPISENETNLSLLNLDMTHSWLIWASGTIALHTIKQSIGIQRC